MKVLTDKNYKTLVDSIYAEAYANARAEYEEFVDHVQSECDKKVQEQSDKVQKIEDGQSSMTFLFDNDLKVTIKSEINSDVSKTLIDQHYIQSSASEDEHAMQVAFILIANEVTEQIISDMEIDDDV